MSIRGEFAQAVLLAVLESGDDAYAVPLRKILETMTGRPVSRGALYTALERLEAKGFLVSAMGEPLTSRGGKARRYYRLTPSGVESLTRTRARLQRLWAGFDEHMGRARGRG